MRPGRGWLYQESSGSSGYSENREGKETMENWKTRSTLESGVAEGWTKESEDELSRVRSEIQKLNLDIRAKAENGHVMTFRTLADVNKK